MYLVAYWLICSLVGWLVGWCVWCASVFWGDVWLIVCAVDVLVSCCVVLAVWLIG